MQMLIALINTSKLKHDSKAMAGINVDPEN
jgi:hypothetical protein